MIKAGMSLLIRLLSVPLRSAANWVNMKRRFWGKVRFNSSVRIALTSSFEGANTIGDNSSFSGSMGYGTYMCNDCSIIGNVGRFCSIAPEVKNSIGVHPVNAPYVSTSPMFFSLRKQSGETFAQKQMFDELRDPIEIGHDCWIGQRAFIVGGVKIGTGAVVLAGAVVTKDVPPYAIVGGVPAKLVKYRYDQHTIDFLLKTEWWNLPIEWLRDNYVVFNDIEIFKRLINENIGHNS